MTDTMTLPALGERLTIQNSAHIQVGDFVWATHRGRPCFGAIRTLERDPSAAKGGAIGIGGMAGPLTYYTFIGRPRRDGWLKFTGGVNPVGETVIEAWLVTGAVMRGRACDFPDVAWQCIISYIRPYTPPPTPSVETLEQAIAALAPFAAVVRSYDAAEDGSHEIWTDHGFVGGPATSVFRLENYRAAAAALEALTGKKLETI
ncbi:hypothetical protein PAPPERLAPAPP_02000 [Brevundimonas phage vB_BpoS-Papperlapapp]|nr:hypothetical protein PAPPERLAPAPP_02000 [Brevundimonas phage vB_BpoS-Papperlapapp]